MTGLSNTYRAFAAAMLAAVLVALSGCAGDTGSPTLTPYQAWYMDGIDYPTYGGR